MDERGRTHLIENIAGHLQQCTDRDIVRRSVLIFANVDEDFGRRLAQKLNIDLPKNVNIPFSLLSPIQSNLLLDIQRNSNGAIEVLDKLLIFLFYNFQNKPTSLIFAFQ